MGYNSMRSTKFIDLFLWDLLQNLAKLRNKRIIIFKYRFC